MSNRCITKLMIGIFDYFEQENSEIPTLIIKNFEDSFDATSCPFYPISSAIL